MAATSASLATLLETKAQIAYWTEQQMIWTRKYDSNLEKLEKYQKYETEWNKAFEKVMDYDGDKTHLECSYGKFQYNIESDAERYANIKVDEHDEEILLDHTFSKSFTELTSAEITSGTVAFNTFRPTCSSTGFNYFAKKELMFI